MYFWGFILVQNDYQQPLKIQPFSFLEFMPCPLHNPKNRSSEMVQEPWCPFKKPL